MSNDRLGRVVEVGEGAGAVRPGRCANHPAVAEVGTCSVCGRPLCIACATPVRGELIGPECLSAVLHEIPASPPAPIRIPPIANLLTLVGFGLVVLLSVFPWSRFGDSSGFFESWSLHWSLLAVAAGLTGLVISIRISRRPADLRLETALQGGLAVVVLVASVLHLRAPPPLSSSAPTPLLAILAGAIAATGPALKLRAILAAKRPPR